MENLRLKNYVEILNLKTIDNNYDVKSNEKVTLMDSDGYLYYLSANNLCIVLRRKTRPAIFFNKNPYAYENINNYLKMYKINIKLITKEPKSAIEKLKFRCLLHGDTFNKSWNEVKNGAYCPQCGNEKREKYSESRKQDFNLIKKSFIDRGFILLTKEYKNNLQPLEFICSKHEDKGIQRISWVRFITQVYACEYCKKEGIIKNQTKSHEKFLEEVREVHGDKIIIKSNYENSNKKLIAYCKDCHTEFLTLPRHLLAGHLGCRCNKKSLGEDKIKDILDSSSASYLDQYRIKECKNKKPLPFDFAIFEDNEKTRLKCLIEYQGRQHYSNTGWSSNREKSKREFEELKMRDNIKKQFCLDNNIKLIEIPYWDFNKLDEIINNIVFEEVI